MTQPTPHHWIDQQDQLLSVLPSMQQASFLALDTEFVRRSTYKPILCLIQIMTDQGEIFLLDACALNLAPFWQMLDDTTAVKVFHDSRQDLEIFWQEAGRLPTSVFDTQLAALLLGYGESCGFGRLVEGELGVTLPKDQTASDWCQRPLTPEQVQYAIDDVVYLARIYPQLLEKLNQKQRLHWIDADNQALSDPALYQADIISLRKKLKAPRHFRAPQRLKLDALLLWREAAALDANKPRQWIADNGCMVAMAEKTPRHLDDLHALRLPAQTLRKHGKTLLELLHNPPDIAQPVPLPEVDNQALSSLRSHIEQVAEQAGLRQSAALATKDDLTWWLGHGQVPEKLSKGWRHHLLQQAQTAELIKQLRQQREALL